MISHRIAFKALLIIGLAALVEATSPAPAAASDGCGVFHCYLGCPSQLICDCGTQTTQFCITVLCEPPLLGVWCGEVDM